MIAYGGARLAGTQVAHVCRCGRAFVGPRNAERCAACRVLAQRAAEKRYARRRRR